MTKHILMLLCLFFVSCADSTKNIQKEMITIATPVEPIGLYPYKANDPYSSKVYSQIFDTLLARDTSNQLVPSLATDWKFVDDLTLELKIRTNVLFHNNEILTVEDVQFSIEKILSTPNIAHTVESIKGVRVVDSNRVQILLKKPDVAVLYTLAAPVMVILNKKAVLESGEDVAGEPIGTGPYKLERWNRGQDLLLSKFDQHWRGAPIMPLIEIRLISDVSARTIALEAGDVDIAFDIEGVDRDRILGNFDLKLFDIEIPRVEYISMNIGKGTNPLWKSSKGRQAFEWAIDKQGIVDSILFGAGTVAGTLVPPMIDGYEALTPRQQNPEKSKELLAELNIPNPKMNILVREGVSQKIAEVIQAQLHEVDIDSTITVAEYGRFLDVIAQGQHDVFILNWSVATGDTDYALNNLLNSGSWGSKGNRSFYSSPEVDRLIQAAKVEKNHSKRMSYYKLIQQIVYDDVPYIPLYYPLISVGSIKEIKNVYIDIFGHISLKDLKF
ncbi:MAG: ABC transporter substrate-binding protein [Brevinema sp.]